MITIEGQRRTIAGVTLRAEKTYWIGTIEGEQWVFEYIPKKRYWHGWTEDHLTGTGLHRSLSRAIRWIVQNREEIAGKLKARRAPKP